MKPIGEILKKHIEAKHLKKGEIAKIAGISYNYLSTIFKQKSCDAGLLERLYVAAGLNPGVVFDVPDEASNTPEGYTAPAAPANDNIRELLADKERLIAEKERTIQLLTRLLDDKLGTNTQQPSQN